MATLQIQAPVSWTTAKLVPEALKHSLHVVEDSAMIHLLGRAKFMELIVFSPVGWQEGVSFLHFSIFLRIYEKIVLLLASSLQISRTTECKGLYLGERQSLPLDSHRFFWS
jgi:hypothetical protein